MARQQATANASVCGLRVLIRRGFSSVLARSSAVIGGRISSDQDHTPLGWNRSQILYKYENVSRIYHGAWSLLVRLQYYAIAPCARCFSILAIDSQ